MKHALLSLSALCLLGLCSCGDTDGTPNQPTDETPDQETPTPVGALAFTPSPDDWVLPIPSDVLSATLVDATQDGVLDIVALTPSGLEILKGDGNAGFTRQVPETAAPVNEEDQGDGEPAPEPEPALTALLAADLNKDGLAEVISGQAAGGALSVYVKAAMSAPPLKSEAIEARCGLLAAADLDGDGTTEAIALHDLGEGQWGVSAWKLGNGALEPLFKADEADEASSPISPLGALSPRAIIAADLNHDGKAQLLITEPTQVRIFALIDGALREQTVIGGLQAATATNLIDIDNDGDLDLHIAQDGQQDRLYASNAAGQYADATWSILPTEDAHSATSAVADFNQDGADDLIIGTSQGYDRLYQGNFAGRLNDQTPALGFIETQTRAMLVGDLDKDGDLDLVSVGRKGQLRIFINQHKRAAGAAAKEGQ